MSNIAVPNFGPLWLPEGYTYAQEREAAKAVREYDADLALGQLEDTKDWVVCHTVAGAHGNYPLPVFNFGRELPGPDDIKRRLGQADIRRRGHEILRDVQRKADAQRKDEHNTVRDGAGEVAETVEWAFRKMGKHPTSRIFIP